MAFDWLSGKWDEIVVQGGRLEKSPSSENYLLSGIWILANSNWLEISAVEIDSEFRLACFKCSNSPIPESNRFFQPERKTVVQFPKDISLDQFKINGVSEVCERVLKHDETRYVFKESLEIGDGSNPRIKIYASKAYLGSIEMC